MFVRILAVLTKLNKQKMFDKKLFVIVVWLQKALFEKAIVINLLRKVFCRNDIIVYKFEKIKPSGLQIEFTHRTWVCAQRFSHFTAPKICSRSESYHHNRVSGNYWEPNVPGASRTNIRL